MTKSGISKRHSNNTKALLKLNYIKMQKEIFEMRFPVPVLNNRTVGDSVILALADASPGFISIRSGGKIISVKVFLCGMFEEQTKKSSNMTFILTFLRDLWVYW